MVILSQIVLCLCDMQQLLCRCPLRNILCKGDSIST